MRSCSSGETRRADRSSRRSSGRYPNIWPRTTAACFAPSSSATSDLCAHPPAWGSRRFATRDDSTNNWWVALLTFGEGWHNNHHAHPSSARHGLAWYEIDLNWIGISTLRILGLAWDIKVAKIRQPVPHEENDTLVLADEAVA